MAMVVADQPLGWCPNCGAQGLTIINAEPVYYQPLPLPPPIADP